jgi:putative flavoprotein involved in K+ transport
VKVFFTQSESEQAAKRGCSSPSSPPGSAPTTGTWCPGPRPSTHTGFPRQQDGASLAVPGLYFVGVHFLRTRKSSLLYGVGEDAAILASSVATQIGT